MKPLWKWLCRLAAVFAIFLAMAFAFQLFVLPGCVESKIIRRLKAMGVRDPTVNVDSVGFGSAHISNISLGGGVGGEPNTLGHAEITYSLASLIAGRFKEVSLHATDVNLYFRNGKLDTANWGQLKNAAWEFDSPLPFDTLNIDGGKLTVWWDENPSRMNIPHARVQATPSSIDALVLLEGYGVLLTTDVSARREKTRITMDKFAMTALLEQRLLSRYLGPANPVNELRIVSENEPVTLTYTEAAWAIAAPRLLVKAGSTADTGEGLGLKMRVGIVASPENLEVALLEPAIAIIPAFTRAVGAQQISVEESAWRITAHSPSPFLRSTKSPQGKPYEAAFSMTADKPLHAKLAGQAALTAGQLSTTLQVKYAGTLPPRVEGTIHLGEAAIDAGAWGSLAGIQGDIPISIFAPTAPPTGSFKIESIRVRNEAFPPLHGTAEISDHGLDLTAQWPLVKETPLELAFTADPGKMRIHAKLPPTKLADLQQFLARFTDLGNTSFNGTASLDAEATYRDGKLETSGKLTLDKAVYRKGETAVENIDGTVTFASLKPLTTAGGQRLSIGRFQQGKLILTEGVTHFRVEAADRFFIESTNWTFGKGGRVTAHAIRYDAADPVLGTELFVENLNLEDWLGVLTGEKVTATGALYGRVPFRIHRGAGQMKVAFGQGFLYSTPGVGTLKLAGTEKVSQLLAKADPRFTSDPQLSLVRERLAEALTDFEYSMFRFNLIPGEEGAASLRVETRGKGQGLGGQEIGSLIVNINNFQSVVNAALFGQALLSGEGIDRGLQEFFKPVEPENQPEVKP